MDDVTLLCQLHTGGKGAADRLRAAGYDTLESISKSQTTPLVIDAGLSKNAARKLIAAASEMLNPVARTISAELLGLGEDEQESYQAEITKGVTLDESAALDGLTIPAAPAVQDSYPPATVNIKPDPGEPEPEDEQELVSVTIDSVSSIREQLIDLVALSIANWLTDRARRKG